MPTQNLVRAFGKGDYKITEGTASLANGGTITAANMSTIYAVVLTAESTTGNYVICNHSISNNVVTVFLAGAASGTAPSTLSGNATVHYQIIGQ